ncbi:hypothetical protein H1C71_035069 [Ictidomys tridecemlineatus]|nr:hypothetical protein H1C71_035069 [Ictidomys tridecemlineatus]
MLTLEMCTHLNQLIRNPGQAWSDLEGRSPHLLPAVSLSPLLAAGIQRQGRSKGLGVKGGLHCAMAATCWAKSRSHYQMATLAIMGTTQAGHLQAEAQASLGGSREHVTAAEANHIFLWVLHSPTPTCPCYPVFYSLIYLHIHY